MEYNIVPVRRYCPNCGNLASGGRDEDGVAKLTCRVCGTAFISKLKSRRHDRLDVYAPRGEEILETCSARERY